VRDRRPQTTLAPFDIVTDDLLMGSAWGGSAIYDIVSP